MPIYEATGSPRHCKETLIRYEDIRARNKRCVWSHTSMRLCQSPKTTLRIAVAILSRAIPDGDFSVRRGRVRPLRREMWAHWTDENSALCSLDHSVYRYTYETGQFEKLFSIPPRTNTLSGRIKDRLARSWVRRYLLPGSGIGNLTRTNDGNVVVTL